MPKFLSPTAETTPLQYATYIKIQNKTKKQQTTNEPIRLLVVVFICINLKDICICVCSFRPSGRRAKLIFRCGNFYILKIMLNNFFCAFSCVSHNFSTPLAHSNTVSVSFPAKRNAICANNYIFYHSRF